MIFCGLGINNAQLYEEVSLSAAKQTVALEVMYTVFVVCVFLFFLCVVFFVCFFMGGAGGIYAMYIFSEVCDFTTTQFIITKYMYAGA